MLRTGLAMVLLTTVAHAQAGGPVDRAALQRCAAIEQSAARLACYDALAERPATPPSASSVRSAEPVAAAAPTTPHAPAATTPASDPSDPKNFGLNAAQQHLPTGPDSINAIINTISGGGIAPTYVQLDNGETWTVLDPDPGLSKGDKVTIKRAALGSFLMTGHTGHKYRVRRIR
jgi:hypothetical protein